MTFRFVEEIDQVQKVVEEFESGRRSNLAIISEPFYGETSLVDKVVEMNASNVQRLKVKDLAGDLKTLGAMSANILIAEDLHRLYLRKIGGFDLIQRFLRYVASSDKLFITTWNSYSWSYLDEALNIGKEFPTQMKLSKKDADQIKEMLISGYEENELEFIEEETTGPDRKLIDLGWHPFSFRGFEGKVPVPYIDVLKLRDRFSRKENKSVDDRFFEKLARISDGNPGVAEVLWKDSLDYPKVVDRMAEQVSRIELDYEESFVLSIIVSMGHIEKGDIYEIVECGDELLYVLSEKGLISMEGEVCTIKPESLKGLVEHLKKQKLVW